MTLNDDKRQDEDKTEGVSERREEMRRVRGGWGSASLVKEKGRVNEESEGGGKKTTGENEAQEERNRKQTIIAAAQQ